MKERLFTSSYIFILAANFLLFFGFWLLIPVLPFYLKETFNCPAAMLGAILSCYTVSGLCVRPFSGFLMDKFPRKPIYILCYFICASIFLGYMAAGVLYLATGRIPERIGNRYESCYPYDSFPCKDGELVIGCANDSLFVKLTNLMGKPELLTDPRFEKNVKRVENHAALRPIVAEWTSQYNRDELVQMILDVGVPAAPINTIADTTKDPHIAGAREMFVEVDHPVAGKMKLTGCHIKMSRTPSEIRTHAPLLGQDNEEVYGSLGYSHEEIARMKEEGVI